MLSIFGSGRVGKDPEMRYTPSGTAVVNFSVACDVGFGEYKKTMWVRLSAFGTLAEAINQYVSKGDTISFIGNPEPDKETGNPKIFNKQDGTAVSSYDVKISEIKFDSKKGGAPKQSDADVEF